MLRAATVAVSDLLTPTRVRVGLAGADKEAVINGVIDLLGSAPEVRDLDGVRADVFAREAVMSTGVGKGLALPHARTRAVSDTVAAFAVTAEPVDYQALDGQPVRLIFLLCGPDDERGTHIKLLSRISRLMNDDDFRARLRDAPDAVAVIAAFRAAEDRIG